jgi:hypothetical protein
MKTKKMNIFIYRSMNFYHFYDHDQKYYLLIQIKLRKIYISFSFFLLCTLKSLVI